MLNGVKVGTERWTFHERNLINLPSYRGRALSCINRKLEPTKPPNSITCWSNIFQRVFYFPREHTYTDEFCTSVEIDLFRSRPLGDIKLILVPSAEKSFQSSTDQCFWQNVIWELCALWWVMVFFLAGRLVFSWPSFKRLLTVRRDIRLRTANNSLFNTLVVIVLFLRADWFKK